MAITVTSGGIAANATTAAPGLGGTASAGDLYIAHCAQDGAGTFTWTSPAVEIKDQAFTGGVNTVAYLIASGGETAMPRVTSTVSERWEWNVWRFPAGEWHGTTPPEINTGVSGNNAAPDPGSIAPSWSIETNNIFLALCARDDSVANTVTGYPANYSTAQADKNDITSAANVAGAVRVVTGTNENPGAFALSATETWIAYTVAIRPAAAGGGTTQSASAALLASAAVAAAAIATMSGAAALSATATLSPTAQLTAAIAAALNASATLTPSAIATLGGSADLTGTATLVAAADIIPGGGGSTQSASAALSASASLAVAAGITATVAAAISANASLAASANITAAISAALSANATLAAAGIATLGGAAALEAVATLSASGEIVGAVVVGDAVIVFTDSMVAVISHSDAIDAAIISASPNEALIS